MSTKLIGAVYDAREQVIDKVKIFDRREGDLKKRKQFDPTNYKVIFANNKQVVEVPKGWILLADKEMLDGRTRQLLIKRKEK